VYPQSISGLLISGPHLEEVIEGTMRGWAVSVPPQCLRGEVRSRSGPRSEGPPAGIEKNSTVLRVQHVCSSGARQEAYPAWKYWGVAAGPDLEGPPAGSTRAVAQGLGYETTGCMHTIHATRNPRPRGACTVQNSIVQYGVFFFFLIFFYFPSFPVQ